MIQKTQPKPSPSRPVLSLWKAEDWVGMVFSETPPRRHRNETPRGTHKEQGECAMKGLLRAFTLATLLAATAAAAQTPSVQRMRFTGDDRTFSVVATATANVTSDESFLHVTLDQGVIRATPVAKEPKPSPVFASISPAPRNPVTGKSCAARSVFRSTSS